MYNIIIILCTYVSLANKKPTAPGGPIHYMVFFHTLYHFLHDFQYGTKSKIEKVSEDILHL